MSMIHPPILREQTATWQKKYSSKLMTADESIRFVQSNMRVYIHSGCAVPEVLVESLISSSARLKNVEVVHLLTMGNADYIKPELGRSFRHNAMFIGSNVREAVNDGRADYTPIFLSEIEGLFESGEMPIDVALIQVSPPDQNGYCSFGVGIDTTLTAAKKARHVLAQVNDHMPRTYGDSFIHVNEIDALVDVSEPICELPPIKITELHKAIAKNVADLIDDGSTIQLGIGGIPNAVLLYLQDRKDLGVHTEMLSDNVIPLIESGVINGRLKTIYPRKVVLSFVLGSRKLFEFVHDNPVFEFLPTCITNDPFRIARNDKMVAVNSALQIDVTGQVCSDSLGEYLYSGIGGQVDFLRGAARSRGGKPIVAIPSTARNGTVSRIVPTLSPGAGVVTTRGAVHYVVTEHGVAYLHGRSIRQRAEALINIAHPQFRDELYAHCERTHWLRRPEAARR